ncbi:FdtA/QdtA family cupin domain-containing protein [Aquiflexum sp. TKW24L]|uniref:sugar 3,4-ketoisomerase n=1 Tax=Aquiflexum sp. TKW24L TaxID=2942212 RepID=UPI0020BF34D8|nr:FdtA/QdtA family cupin domain-containing protein [Aquiflexum sp. TKW24L]MCL6261232.1 FdtA/QdtA family cupin domain-containing protein [Aquiflexum sp. TKW24L]
MKIDIIDIDKPQLVDFQKVGSSSLGYISVAEELPFEIKRVYWTYYAPHEVTRGHHAHKELKQVIFAVSGSIKFELENIAGQKTKFVLDSPDIGLYIPKLYWRTMQFSHNAVLLCLASDLFLEEDYIRDYNSFKRWT